MRIPLAFLSCTFLAIPVLSMPSSMPQPDSNPFFVEWETPFGVPPFGQIKEQHFLPAFQRGMADQKKEVDAIAASRQAPTFENTIAALDATGVLLAKVGGVFSNLTSAETNDTLQAIQRQVAPLLAAHRDDINLNPGLFKRVAALWEKRFGLKLDPEQARLLETTYKDFVRGGAALSGGHKDRFRAINAELASLSVRFGENLLKEMNSYRLVVSNKADLAGLPDMVIAGAAEAARKAGMDAKWVFTLHAPSLWPFLQYADNRELRRQIFKAYITRCDHNDATDNKAVLSRIAALRAERASLLGYKTHADFVLEENMASTPAKVYELLNRLWDPAKEVSAREVADIQAVIRSEGGQFKLEPWDWFYYTEKVRKAKYSLDGQALRPYFKLENVRDGAFAVAGKLYGISITPLKNVPVYNPEVKAFEVRDGDGSHLAVFYVDYHPRPGKRGGAWSSRYRGQWVESGKEVRPVVVNVCNFSRAAGDTPALLSLEEASTLFHEFGHALNSIFSKIRYRSLASTPRDFVELPSQIMENWAFEPDVLKMYAQHYKTGEVIPVELVEKVKKTAQFNQGFATVEYLAASILDMDWHTLPAGPEKDTAAFENGTLTRIAMPAEIIPRYRSSYFQHIFSGGYSAGYYSYIWSEVLDSDAFELFKARGIFDQATARSFREQILAKAGTDKATAMYKRFRGAEPSVEPLLKRRGLK